MTYSSEVLADSPLGYWKFDEASGTSFADSSGNARDLTLTGSSANLSYSQAPLASGLGNSINFGGVSGTYPQLTSGPAHTGSATLEGWIKPSNLPAGNPRGFLDMNSEARLLRFGDAGLPLGRPQWRLDGTVRLTTAFDLANGVVYHVVLTYDTTTGDNKLYIDGSLVATVAGTTGASPLAAGVWRFLFDFSNGRELGGPVSNFAVYTTALSAARVAAHFAAGSPPPPVVVLAPPLLARTRLQTATVVFPPPVVVQAPPLMPRRVRIPTPTVTVPVNTPLGRIVVDPSQGWGFDLGARITLGTLEPDDGTGSTQIRYSETYPDPVIVDGRPT